MATSGLAVAALVAAALVAAWQLTPRPFGFAWHGWGGLAVLGVCAALLASSAGQPAFWKPLAASGYVLAVDAAVYAVRGRSMLRNQPDAFAWLAILSIFLWLPFEWYNLRLGSWYRAGLPSDPTRYLLLGWAFACIWPALFETADLFLATVLRSAARRTGERRSRRQAKAWLSAAAGVVCLAVPLLVPRLDLGEHLFGLTFVGTFLLLDPVNCRYGWPSIRGWWSAGRRNAISAIMLAGPICLLFATALNSASEARWYWISSFGGDARLLAVPLATYAVSPLFGPAGMALYVYAARRLGLATISLEGPTAGVECA